MSLVKRAPYRVADSRFRSHPHLQPRRTSAEELAESLDRKLIEAPELDRSTRERIRNHNAWRRRRKQGSKQLRTIRDILQFERAQLSYDLGFKDDEIKQLEAVIRRAMNPRAEADD